VALLDAVMAQRKCVA